MRRMIAYVFAFSLFSIATPAFAGDALKDAIQAREDAWSAAYNANDADALGAIYEEDAVLVPPGSPPVHGRAGIQEALAGLFATLKDVTLTADDVRPMGDDYAVEVGRASFDVLGEDGSLTPAVSDYIVVWHKGDDGVWYYTHDIFNDHGPTEEHE